MTWLESSEVLRAFWVGREGWPGSQLDEAKLRFEASALCLHEASWVTGEEGVQTARAAGQVPDLVGGTSTGMQAVLLIFLL